MNINSSKANLKRLFIFFSLTAVFLAACAAAPTIEKEILEPTAAATATLTFEQHELDPDYAALIAAQRDPRVPDLPFPDNPDPSQCGIPTQWGLDDPAWLNGFYEGELLFQNLTLYDSHLRLGISGEAPHGSELTVILYQQNPVTDYYLVKVKNGDQPFQGWIPAPFLSFEPVEPLTAG